MNTLVINDKEAICLQAMRALAVDKDPDREVRVLVIGDVHRSTDVEQIRRALEGKYIDGAHISVLTGVPSRSYRTLVVDDELRMQGLLAAMKAQLEAQPVVVYAPEAVNKPWYRQHAKRGRRRAY